MGFNPTRNPFKQSAVEPTVQQAVDEYKARSIWGLWWSLSEETRRRYFNEDERAWIRRYGAELDEIACLSRDPRNDRERHFLAVCNGTADPRNERERLWLRAQIVCRFPSTADRAARTDLAEHHAATLSAELGQLRRDLREAEEVAMEATEEVKMLGGDFDVQRKRSLCNVAWASSIFASTSQIMGPSAVRLIMTPASRGTPVQVLPPSPAGIGQ